MTTDSAVEMFSYLFFGQKMITSVLLAFKFILFAPSQWHIKESSRFTYLLIFLSELSVNNKFVFSNFLLVHDLLNGYF